MPRRTGTAQANKRVVRPGRNILTEIDVGHEFMGDKGFEGSMEVEAGVSLHWQSDKEGNQEASSNRTIPPPFRPPSAAAQI